MSLDTMRCDRCGELESALFIARPEPSEPIKWYCELCMRASGQGWRVREYAEIVQILKRLNEEQQ